MPPRVKFSREEIVQAALDVAREKGADAMTTRDIAARLGVSTQPIFTYFRSMAEVRAAVHAAAETFYQKYAAEGLAEEIPFLGYGMRHIRFHDLRHTFASILINKDIPLFNVSKYLGHSDISTTANIYAHLDKSGKDISAETISALFDDRHHD